MLVESVVFGLLIGASLGALGGGGSILTVPVLVFVIGETPKAATAGSLVIVGLTALIGAVGQSRAGRTRWQSGLLLAAAGVPAALAGTRFNREVDPDVLLLAFAALMLVAAAAMLLRDRFRPAAARPEHVREDGASGGAVALATRTSVSRSSLAATWPRLVAAGLGIGFLTGFLGVGGGFVVVPVLVVLLEFPMPVAVGTSLLVISINSAVSLAARAGTAHFDARVIVPFTVSAIAGSLAASRISDRVPALTLTRAFAGLLVAVAAYVAIRAGTGLS